MKHTIKPEDLKADYAVTIAAESRVSDSITKRLNGIIRVDEGHSTWFRVLKNSELVDESPSLSRAIRVYNEI